MSPRVADPGLRDRLVAAAARILAEEGPAALTARRLAAQTGCSTMAVYTRFGSMADLALAIRQDGFTRLAQRLDALSPSTDPVANVVATSVTFFHFGMENPHLYRAMFIDRPPTDDDTGAATYQRLVDEIQACIRAGRFPAGGPSLPPVWAAQLWSMRHGMVTMALTGLLPPGQAQFALADMTLRLLIGYGDDPDQAKRSLVAGSDAVGGSDAVAGSDAVGESDVVGCVDADGGPSGQPRR